MSLPEINFDKIRPYDGSQNTGFEELSTQLAALEPAANGSNFYRKGRGADAGVECYRVRPDGTEIGWQAKYIFEWSQNLASQLDESIQTALAKHPKLTEYIVCLPFDPPDARVGKAKSALAKWQEWRSKWQDFARDKKRKLTITLWGRTELVRRLTRDDGQHSGRVLYWFGVEAFTKRWFIEQFEKAKASLGPRYTPETNVSLPIRRDFLAFGRDLVLQNEIHRWFLRLAETGSSAADAVRSLATGGADIHSSPLRAAVQELSDFLGRPPLATTEPFPLEKWREIASRCADLAKQALRWTHHTSPATKPGPTGSDSQQWAQVSLHKLLAALNDIEEATFALRWKLANARTTLLTGPAGIGKSHLLADIVEHEVHEGRPAILILGNSLRDDEPWRQILAQLDRPPNEQIKSFLGSLDAAAEATGTRAMVCIDALNERHGIDIWPARLARFLAVAADFPRVVVLLSCRSTYIPYVIPDETRGSSFFAVEHPGFGGDGGSAARAYLDKRGIVRHGAPLLAPEFDNPLFLKTCCDFLERDGKKEIPRGLRGVTSIFDFYIGAITRALNRRMQLDPHLGIVKKAVDRLAQLVAKEGRGAVRKAEVIALFEGIRASGGLLEASLLSQLESEGLLTIDVEPQDDGSVVEMVRFTFERFSDLVIGKQMLANHLDKDNVPASFAAGTPLGEFVFGSTNYERAGAIEAIAIQLPEQTDHEILDVGGPEKFTVHEAFAQSLLWREQDRFTERTFTWAERVLAPDDLNDLLVAISSEPQNRFNAQFLHKALWRQSLAERDQSWSIWLAVREYDGSVKTLIDWALNNGLEHVDDERAYLASLMLTWLLTTSHRTVRDRATKSLACMLSSRLSIAGRLLREFAEVNDPYVLERLVGACYGAVLQGATDGLTELADTVFQLLFAQRTPPADILLRDHALGILEYANWRGNLPGAFDIASARPPYKSAWPIERVPDEVIESYTVSHPQGSFRDSIASSTAPDGDFARYVMDHSVQQFSASPIGTWPLPTTHDIAEGWWSDFKAWATPEQRAALDALSGAIKATKDQPIWAQTAETKERDKARAAFKALLSSEQWEDYRARADGFVAHQLHSDHPVNHPARFDFPWARRWVCKRAHDLGWTADRFQSFDNSQRSHDRMDHEVERIGKKYQWIALRELLARMADNLAFAGDSWSDDNEQQTYQSARQIRVRDIDPSLLTANTNYDGWAEWPKTWWVPVQPNLRPVSPQERLAWLNADTDVFNDSGLIDVTNPRNGRRWLTLATSAHWSASGVRDGYKELQRTTWFKIASVVVRKDQEKALIKGLRGQLLTDRTRLPQIDLNSEFWLGEYPWQPDLQVLDQWGSEDDWRPTPVPTRPTVATYTCEKGNYDYSVDRTVSLELPAPWLAKAMGLRMTNGRAPVYVDATGKDIFYDPSVRDVGSSTALVDRGAFLEMLERENLSAVWIIAGEKCAHGGRDAGKGFGGRMLYTALYRLKGEGFDHVYHEGHQTPSYEQLIEFFGPEGAPAAPSSSSLSHVAGSPKKAAAASKKSAGKKSPKKRAAAKSTRAKAKKKAPDVKQPAGRKASKKMPAAKRRTIKSGGSRAGTGKRTAASRRVGKKAAAKKGGKAGTAMKKARTKRRS